MQHLDLELHLNTRKDINELRLIRRCKEGDRSAQRKVFDLLAPKMFALCKRYMKDRDAAEDVLQEGFITLFSKLDSYSEEGSFEGWARRIFVNTALMSLRKSDLLKDANDLETVQDTSPSDPQAYKDIGYNELLALIDSLPDKFRIVFILSVIEGYSHKEISEMLEITEPTSRSQLQRARVMLQKKIKDR